MDWNDLRYFLAVARARTLASAARELGVEHTTVGRRLAALESALGSRLFIRGPDGLSLTSAGTDILSNVEAIAEHVSTIERRVSGLDARIEGTVRLTIPEGVNPYVIAQLSELRDRHPSLMVEVLNDNRESDLRRGEAEVAIRLRSVTDPDLVARKIGIAGWALYAAPAYVERKGALASPEDLRGHDVIGFDRSLGGVTGAQFLEAHADGANIVLRGNSIAAVAKAASVGFGIAPLPCITGDAEPALTRIAKGLVGTRDILLVVHPDLARVARVRAAMDFLVELFARDASLWSGEP